MASFTAGTTFTDGVANDVTAAKLGALVTSATPTSGLIQDRTSETVIATNDTLLIGDASDSNNLKKMTVANVMKAELTGTINTTAGTIATLNGTTGAITTLTTGTTTSTAEIVTSGTIATLNSTTGTIATLNSTTGTIGTLVATGTITGSTNVINIGSGQIYKDATGNVGIGTTPSRKLDVNGVAGATYLMLTSNTASAPAVDAAITRIADGTLGLITNSAERLRIDSTGNVGINTTTGSAKLDVRTTGDGNWAARFLNSTTSDSPNGVQVVVGQNSLNAVLDVAQGTSYTSPTSLLRILGNGNVGINRSSPDTSLHILEKTADANSGLKIQENVSASKYYRILYVDSSGVLRFNNGSNEATITLAGSFVNASDSRLKKDITEIKYGLNEVMESKPRSFNRVDVAGEYFGFIAQELQGILPEAISGDPESQLGVDYGSLVAVAFRAIQELKFENDSLKSRIEALEAK
jgi:hypothetical protein